ncbi:hypothetical protein KEM54_002978 [Ascosphaera aggregata]|nr:hypothetical protein KEM54_002978 [Ascosphaera aggregata]
MSGPAQKRSFVVRDADLEPLLRLPSHAQEEADTNNLFIDTPNSKTTAFVTEVRAIVRGAPRKTGMGVGYYGKGSRSRAPESNEGGGESEQGDDDDDDEGCEEKDDSNDQRHVEEVEKGEFEEEESNHSNENGAVSNESAGERHAATDETAD